jgi:hypothetical protein
MERRHLAGKMPALHTFMQKSPLTNLLRNYSTGNLRQSRQHLANSRPIPGFNTKMCPGNGTILRHYIGRRVWNLALLWVKSIKQAPLVNHSQVGVGQNWKGQITPFPKPKILFNCLWCDSQQFPP